MRREFFTPEPSFAHPSYYFPRDPNHGFTSANLQYDISQSGPRLGEPTYRIPPVNKYGINRPDPVILYNSVASGNRNLPLLHRYGCSSTFEDRSKYLPSTPKVRTSFPRFHTGFYH